MLHIRLDRDTVGSPDTLTGAITVTDADGIDSVWLTVDTVRRGDDGFFETRYDNTFRFPIPGGFVKGQVVPIRLEARDVAGFQGGLDTGVAVRGP